MAQDTVIYTPEEIEKVRVACKLAQEVLVYLEPHVKPGVTTAELDRLAEDYIVNVQKAIPACKGYKGYPCTLCTSINEVICHGIPSDKVVLRHGDILNIDVTVIKDGYYGDNSKMYIVGGSTGDRAQLLVDKTQEALYNAIKNCYDGQPLSVIGDVINETVKPHSFSIVRTFIGHGCGKDFHTSPEILHYPNNYPGIMQEGMIFTIEPMINAGDWREKILKDGWTAITKDKKNSAQFEHQILITKDGCEVLTIREEEEKAGIISRIMVNRPQAKA